MKLSEDIFEEAFQQSVETGNRLAAKDTSAEMWEIADGMLAGAIQFWLYSRQPCGDPLCENCDAISTADLRMAEIRRLVEEFATESEYYHAPTDTNAGRA